jgi:hypothetical protein
MVLLVVALWLLNLLLIIIKWLSLVAGIGLIVFALVKGLSKNNLKRKQDVITFLGSAVVAFILFFGTGYFQPKLHTYLTTEDSKPTSETAKEISNFEKEDSKQEKTQTSSTPKNNKSSEENKYEIVSISTVAHNTKHYKLKTNAKTKEEYISIIKDIALETKSKDYDGVFIDFYNFDTKEPLNTDNQKADGGIAYTNIGRAQTLLEENNTFYIEIGNDLETQEKNHYEGEL